MPPASARPWRTDRVVLRGSLVLPGGVVDDGLVVTEGDRLTWVGPVTHAPRDVVDVRLPPPTDLLLLPGLVDLHCHGGGGGSFPDATTPGEARTVVAEHLAHGTTRQVASLVTAPVEVLLERTALLAGLAEAGEVLGVHVEGPFLAPARRGAQDPTAMSAGDPGLVRDLAAAARGHLVAMTVAPEVPGVLGPGGVVEVLAEVGALPSFGHTDASAGTTREALVAARTALARRGGARASATLPMVTHLFNGMPPMHHRVPGPAAPCLAAAARGAAVVELVADGVHLAPETVRLVFDVAEPCVVLVTDAMAATGVADGEHVLGGARVLVTDGVARLSDGGALAGGTAHLLDVVRSVVSAGVDLVAAVRAASATPAATLGRHDVGALEAGRRADVVVTDRDLRPLDVLRDGRRVGSDRRDR